MKPVLIDKLSPDNNSWVFPGRKSLSDKETRAINERFLSGNEYDAYMRRLGAVDTEGVNLTVVVEGARPYPVRVLDMRVEKRCVSPGGVLFFSPTQGADKSTAIGFDLDRRDPKPLIPGDQSDPREWKGDYFDQHTMSLKPQEQVVFRIRAVTDVGYCAFRIVLVVADKDRLVRQMLDNDGRPFRVCGLRGSPGGKGLFSRFDGLYVGGVFNLRDGDGRFARRDPGRWQAADG
ncbi:hypothetical protein AB0B54_19625 [Microbispora bryophytorum]|uniref:hypothetical protein n=1 Tax=Microbispora bryophytorum TaxID=1460882 RepID=UPI0033DD461F